MPGLIVLFLLSFVAVIAINLVVPKDRNSSEGARRSRRLRLEPSVKTESESTIAKDLFDKEDVTAEEVSSYLQERGVHYDDIETLTEFVNTVSRNGLMRHLNYAREKDESSRRAAVILVYMCGISYELIWEQGFMSEYDARELLFKSGIDFYERRDKQCP